MALKTTTNGGIRLAFKEKEDRLICLKVYHNGSLIKPVTVLAEDETGGYRVAGAKLTGTSQPLLSFSVKESDMLTAFEQYSI